jgi:hypothetical protein
MSIESWLKIGLPAFPLAFTIVGAWWYWGDNPLALLPPPIAFWGLVVLFYLFTNLYIPTRRYTLFLTIFASLLWLVSSITSHNLGRFITSKQYGGVLSAIETKDFWYAYICAIVGGGAAVMHFLRYEPDIVAKVRQDKAQLDAEQ